MAVLIFVTKMSQFAINGYEVSAIGYILKPVNAYSLYVHMPKALNMISANTEKKIVLQMKQGIVSFSTRKLIYIEVSGHKLNYHLRGETHEAYGNLTDEESNMKKLAVGSYFNALAAVLGVAGLIATIVSSTMTTAYALGSLGMIAAIAVVAVALCGTAIYAPTRWGNYDYVSTASMAAAIALFAYVISNVINERVLMIAGLFSYNSGNTIGWQVFYVTIAAVGCFLAAILLLIVGSFLKSTKDADLKA